MGTRAAVAVIDVCRTAAVRGSEVLVHRRRGLGRVGGRRWPLPWNRRAPGRRRSRAGCPRRCPQRREIVANGCLLRPMAGGRVQWPRVRPMASSLSDRGWLFVRSSDRGWLPSDGVRPTRPIRPIWPIPPLKLKRGLLFSLRPTPHHRPHTVLGIPTCHACFSRVASGHWCAGTAGSPGRAHRAARGYPLPLSGSHGRLLHGFGACVETGCARLRGCSKSADFSDPRLRAAHRRQLCKNLHSAHPTSDRSRAPRGVRGRATGFRRAEVVGGAPDELSRGRAPRCDSGRRRWAGATRRRRTRGTCP